MAWVRAANIVFWRFDNLCSQVLRILRVPGCILEAVPLGLGAPAAPFQRRVFGDIGPYNVLGLYWGTLLTGTTQDPEGKGCQAIRLS